MLRTFQSFEYQNPKKRQVTFSLSQLLRRKTVSSPEEIMNNKMNQQPLPIQRNLRTTYTSKTSQSRSCKRLTPKINYQILRTKSYTRIKIHSQPKINGISKIQAQSRQNQSPHINIKEAPKYSKVGIKEKIQDPKNQKFKSLKHQSTILNNSIQNFASLKTFNKSKNMVFKQSLDLGEKKQFLKKGSSLQKHIFNNLKNKVLQQNFSYQKFQYLDHQISNLTKLYKGLCSSIYSADFFCQQPTKIYQKTYQPNCNLQNKSVKRLKTYHNFGCQKSQKQKQLVGWQISPQFQFSIQKKQLNSDSIFGSSFDQTQRKNSDFLNRKKIKTLSQRKKFNVNLLKS